MVTHPVRTVAELGIVAEVAKSFLQYEAVPHDQRHYLNQIVLGAFFDRIDDLVRASA